MAQANGNLPSLATFQKRIDEYIDSIKEDVWDLNKQVHSAKEIAFKEFQTHDIITSFLERQSRNVTRHAFDLETAFESRTASTSDSSSTGTVVNFNAEYDALPGLGHACGHNLICVAGVAAYLALGQLLIDDTGLQGQTQLLGTPAEEEGGGKILLIERGAYKGAAVSLMAHPTSQAQHAGTSYIGISGQTSLAIGELLATYTGRPSHASANPWDGVNALDAVVSGYNNISLLRQQLRPNERVHGAILSTPPIANAIPAYTQVRYTIRTPTIGQLNPLMDRVRNCLEAGALATGCSSEIIEPDARYADIKVNLPLAEAFTDAIANWDLKMLTYDSEGIPASTDMGNVTQVVPGLHANVGLDVDAAGEEGAFPHNGGFERVVGTREAFERFMSVAKAMALVGVRVLTDPAFKEKVRREFEGKV